MKRWPRWYERPFIYTLALTLWAGIIVRDLDWKQARRILKEWRQR